MQKFLLIFLFGLGCGNLFSSVVEGYVYDQDGQPLTHVNVLVQEANSGTTTNSSGKYALRLAPGTYSLVFSSLGYQTVIKSISLGEDNLKLNVTLKVKPYEMVPITITGDGKDPAYFIIEQAIANKKKYLHQYKSYKRETYRKLTLEKEIADTSFSYKDSLLNGLLDTFQIDTSLATDLMLEVASQTYFQQPDKIKEIKEAYRERKQGVIYHQRGRFGRGSRGFTNEKALFNPYLFAPNQASTDISFYENLLDISDLGQVPYLSPLANSAMLSYRYELLRTFRQDSLIIHEIAVKPRRKDAALFSGTIFITEGQWSVYAVDFTVAPATLDFFKEFQMYISYDFVNDSIWVTEKENYLYRVKDGKQILYGHTEIIHSEYTINPDLPKHFFRNELSLTLDDAYEKDSTYWDQVRPVKLKPHEMEFISTQDSMINYHKTEEFLDRQDSIYNAIHWLDFLIFGVGHRNTYRKFEIFLNPLVFSAKPFWIGGYRHAVGGYFGKEFKRGYDLNVSGEIDYNFLNEVVKGRVQSSFLYNPKRFARLQIKYGNVYSLVNSYESLVATFGGGNYVNERYYGIGHSHELRNGIFLRAEVEYAERKPLGDLIFSEWMEEAFGEYSEPRDFEPFDEFLLTLELRVVPFQKYYTEPYKKVIVGSDWPEFRLNYKKGIPGIWGSDTDFDLLDLTVEHNFKIGAFGKSRWNLNAGTFLNDHVVEISDYKYFRRSDPYLFSNPLRSFQLLILTDPIFTTNPYLQVGYLHRFNGTLMNKVPLVRYLGLQTMGGAGFLAIQDQSFVHAELFVGLEKAFRIRQQLFRVGAYYVTSGSNHSTMEGAFKFGIGLYNVFSGEWSY